MKNRCFKLESEPSRWRFERAIVGVMLAAFISLGAVETAHSLTTRLGDDARLDWDTTLSYELSMRVKDQNNTLLADPNGDDGNRSFD